MSIEISANLATTTLKPSPPAPSLNNEQKEKTDSILSDYDNTTLTEQDAKDLVAAFQEAGIKPSKDFADTLKTAGFDAHQIGDLAGVETPPPPSSPPQQLNVPSAGLNQENRQLLQSILEQYTDIWNLSAEDEQTLSNSLLAAGLLEPGALIDTES